MSDYKGKVIDSCSDCNKRGPIWSAEPKRCKPCSDKVTKSNTMTAFDKAWGIVKSSPQEDDAFECKCGNDSFGDGFETTVNGKPVEPNADGPWDGEYTCNKCGKVYR